jgi:hypothetical protein
VKSEWSFIFVIHTTKKEIHTSNGFILQEIVPTFARSLMMEYQTWQVVHAEWISGKYGVQ